jgi:hypothetical protein
VLGCLCHHPNVFKRCTRAVLDEGHVLTAKLADFGTHTHDATGQHAGTEGYKSVEAQRGNEAVPLWMSDVTAFGVMMANALACVTGTVERVRKRAWDWFSCARGVRR